MEVFVHISVRVGKAPCPLLAFDQNFVGVCGRRRQVEKAFEAEEEDDENIDDIQPEWGNALDEDIDKSDDRVKKK